MNLQDSCLSPLQLQRPCCLMFLPCPHYLLPKDPGPLFTILGCGESKHENRRSLHWCEMLAAPGGSPSSLPSEARASSSLHKHNHLVEIDPEGVVGVQLPSYGENGEEPTEQPHVLILVYLLSSFHPHPPLIPMERNRLWNRLS